MLVFIMVIYCVKFTFIFNIFLLQNSRMKCIIKIECVQ